MAAEIRYIQTLQASKGGATISHTTNKIVDMAGDEMISNVQSVGTSAEALVLGDLASVGCLKLTNLDDTNYVEVDAVNTFDAFPQKILAGQSIFLAPQTTTIYAKSNTATCNLFVVATEP